jgi:hypothetical protein
MTLYTEKKYFLKNSNLIEEIHKSKISYCCSTDKRYENYDIICDSYRLITPNIIKQFFDKNEDRNDIIIRVMTCEHVSPYITLKNGKINLQEIKMVPFKHFLLKKDDFEKVFDDCGKNISLIEEKNEKINSIKELVKDNKRSIRFNKLNKSLQEPYKELNKKCLDEIKQLIKDIKKLSEEFSSNIRKVMIEVLRSHWKGNTIESGEYCITHGNLTDGLVYMLMLLIDQFAKSGNWSGYSWLEDMKSSALVQLCDVVLKFEENKSNNPFAYLTQIASMKFTATLNSEKTQTKIKSWMLQSIGYDASYNETAELEYNSGKEYWEESNIK